MEADDLLCSRTPHAGEVFIPSPRSL